MNAQQRYDKFKTKMISFKVIKNTESDILKRLDSVPNRAGYIKSLIRADIERDKNAEENKMRKFEIVKKTVEIKKKNASEIRKGVAMDCEYPEVLKRFDTLEEAREAFKEFKTEIREFSTSSGKCFDISEYYLEESDCDDDLPRPDIDVWEISPIEIRVVDDETHETVGVFATYEDAINEVSNSDVFLSIELF